MVNIVPVDLVRYTNKGWRRPTGYAFAASEPVVPIGASELFHAAVAMPIGFVERSGRYVPVVLMAITQGVNLFVSPNGEWFGRYIPFALRSYPFYRIHPGGAEQGTLGVDEDSGLVCDASDDAEKFFDADGNPTARVREISEFLHRVEQDRMMIDFSVRALREAGVIKPWPATVAVGKQEATVRDLLGVDEAALNALDDAAFIKLRKASALNVAYAQIMSKGQLTILGQLALLRQQPANPTQTAPQ
jgi:SapC